MEPNEKKDDKGKKPTLYKVIIFILVALISYKIGSEIISGMRKAADKYNTEQNSTSPN